MGPGPVPCTEGSICFSAFCSFFPKQDGFGFWLCSEHSLTQVEYNWSEKGNGARHGVLTRSPNTWEAETSITSLRFAWVA